MKTQLLLMNAAILLAFSACNSKQNNQASADSTTNTETQTVTTKVVPGSYVNLATGKPVYIVMDPETGYAIDSIEKVPIEFYVNPSTSDTIYQTGEIVNNEVINTNGTWSLSPDAKVKMNGDKMKIKDGDTKIKVNGEDSKVKDADSKTKAEDGDVKTKDR